jgi:hypothetical protein
MTTANLIENLTDEMEVIETTATDTPEAAAKAGERIARKYQAQGWACECIGAVAMQKAINIGGATFARVKDQFGLYHHIPRERYADRIVYHPVIFPKPPTIEE